jgi:predicted nucleotide-binding protein
MIEQAHAQYDVFISYSHSENDWVHGKLVPDLQAAGLKVLIGSRDFEVGVPTITNLERAIQQSECTLVVVSPGWLESEWNQFEGLLTASADPAGRKRKLIPLIYAPCKQLPLRIAMLTCVDLTDPDTRTEQMERLLRGLDVDADSAIRVARRARVFISYKRDVAPDERVALEIQKALGEQHAVFIDQAMPVGTHWAERIEQEIAQADFLITLLSAQSAHSEMVKGEIKTAARLAQENNGKPTILPVRLNYHEPFQYPLSEYLNHIKWASWDDPADTAPLIDNLLAAISGAELKSRPATAGPATPLDDASPFPRPFYSAQIDLDEGTMALESAFYIERACDPIALETIKREGVTITIKGPRQMGKSSLLIRIMQTAREAHKCVAFLDFQLFDTLALSDADRFFRQFCIWLTDALELPDRVDEFWNVPLGNGQRCTRYVSRYLLPALDAPLVLAMDEVESIFDTSFRSDFFGMLRAWHNGRATAPIWKQLDLALVTSTEPYQLIENLNQSPFNVGQVIDLADFTARQIADLNQRHGQSLSADEQRRLIELIGGHPYLVRRALYLSASQQITVATLFGQAADDRGPFGDHLRYHLFRIHDKKDLVQGLLQIIRHHTCPNEAIFWKLRGAGLVSREPTGAVLPRNKLYEEYFKERLHD